MSDSAILDSSYEEDSSQRDGVTRKIKPSTKFQIKLIDDYYQDKLVQKRKKIMELQECKAEMREELSKIRKTIGVLRDKLRKAEHFHRILTHSLHSDKSREYVDPNSLNELMQSKLRELRRSSSDL